MVRGRWRRSVVALAVLCLLACGREGPARPDESPAAGAAAPPSLVPATRVVVGLGSVGGTSLPMWVAREAGTFAERNLDVDLQVLPGTRSTQALAAGETQVATGDALSVVAAALGGLDVAIIATPMPTLLYQIRAQPAVDGPAAVRGARFGITTRGSSTDYTARRVLKQWGLDADRDVQLLELRDQPGILAGLQGGSIDVGVLGSPTQQMAERLGFRNLLSVADEGWEFGLGTIDVRRGELAARRGVYLRFLEGYIAGLQRMKGDREFTIAVAAEANKLDERDLLEDYYATLARHASAFPLTPPGAVQAPLDLLGADLSAARTAQPEAFIDNSLLEELHASGRLAGGTP
jgi:NitT/TauT family transport system substrate-binding protein